MKTKPKHPKDKARGGKGAQLARTRPRLLPLLLRSGQSFFQGGGPTSAAAIAYNTLFTLFPGVLTLLGIGEKIFVDDQQGRQAVLNLLHYLPSETGNFIKNLLLSMQQRVPWGFIVANGLVFIWAGLWVFHLLEEAMDKAWDVKPRRSFWHSTGIDLLMLVFCTLCLLKATSLMAAIHLWDLRFLTVHTVAKKIAVETALNLCALFFVALMFSVIFKVVPNARVRWRTAFRAGFLTGVIWHLVNWAFAWVIPAFDYQRVYGSLSAGIIFLIWVYVSCWIIIFGAHFTYHAGVRPPGPAKEAANNGIA